jgi:hypothetical protein
MGSTLRRDGIYHRTEIHCARELVEAEQHAQLVVDRAARVLHRKHCFASDRVYRSWCWCVWPPYQPLLVRCLTQPLHKLADIHPIGTLPCRHPPV